MVPVQSIIYLSTEAYQQKQIKILATIHWSGDKTENCNQFLATKNIGKEPLFAIVAHVTIFDYFG
jgi:hypothetical protein